MTAKTPVARVELQPGARCTIQCCGCQHLSPQRSHAGERDKVAADYLPHLHRLWAFARWQNLFVGGGEPFLHRDLPGFLDGVQDGPWRDRKPHLITNGYWLLRDDWRAVAAPVAGRLAALVVSRYPAYVDRLGVAEWDRRLDLIRADHPGLHLTIFHGGDPADLRFMQNGFHDEPRPIAEPNPCAMRFCFQLLTDGTLAKCPLGLALDLIPNATAAFRAEYRASSLYDLARGGEGFAEWAAPDAHPACSLCGIGTGDSWSVPWSSDRRIATATGAEYGRLIGAGIAH